MTSLSKTLYRIPSDTALQCKYCNKQYLSSSECYKHEHNHLALGCACMICGSKFKVESELCDHLPMHNADSKVQCNDCGKLFSTRRTLKRHSEVHMGLYFQLLPVWSGYATREHLCVHVWGTTDKATPLCVGNIHTNGQVRGNITRDCTDYKLCVYTSYLWKLTKDMKHFFVLYYSCGIVGKTSFLCSWLTKMFICLTSFESFWLPIGASNRIWNTYSIRQANVSCMTFEWVYLFTSLESFWLRIGAGNHIWNTYSIRQVNVSCMTFEQVYLFTSFKSFWLQISASKSDWNTVCIRQANVSCMISFCFIKVSTWMTVFVLFERKKYYLHYSYDQHLFSTDQFMKLHPCLVNLGSNISKSSSNLSTDILYQLKNLSSYCLYSLYKVKNSPCSSLFW